ncbi:predicted protein [Nematostella vectensis]|uniref:Protein kinase domain-containing protein n=1 Tax=Nematostella vectensis TaxID=45351 RepID=A7SPJ1_NEMVE|nr:predicted protein [Nematostella vectensis]|eukprot:XP_001626476.1 predicted protein [Nematostella vectensis]
MGAECSVYKDYDLEEPLETSSSDWVLYPAQSRGEGPSTRILKVLRHPAILKYYSSHNGSDEVAMVTEPVEPLEHVLNDLAVDEIVAGIYNIVQALVFLHDNGGLSHNSVGLSSVYVSVYDGAWKLGGMQCVSKFTEVTNEFLETAKPLRDSKSITPEEKVNARDGKISLVPEVYHSLDAYAFGMFVCDVLESRPDLIGSESDRFSALMQNSFLHNTPKMRPKLCTLLDNEFFKNDYLDVLSFLNNITVKTDIDKEKFFCSLAVKLKGIPADVVAKRLLPRLLNRFVLAEPSAEKEFLPHILSPCDGKD